MKKKTIIILIGSLVLLAALVDGGLWLYAKHWDSENGFPWKDVEACIDDDAETLKSICPFCWHKKKRIYFRSPDWTWRELCGRSGELIICEHCKLQFDFDCESMN